MATRRRQDRILAWSFGVVATIAVTEVVGEVARRWHADRTWRAAERAQARQDRKVTFVVSVETRQHLIHYRDGSPSAWCTSTHYDAVDPTAESRRRRAAAETKPLQTVDADHATAGRGDR
jgi:hypothetical protein